MNISDLCPAIVQQATKLAGRAPAARVGGAPGELAEHVAFLAARADATDRRLYALENREKAEDAPASPRFQAYVITELRNQFGNGLITLEGGAHKWVSHELVNPILNEIHTTFDKSPISGRYVYIVAPNGEEDIMLKAKYLRMYAPYR